MGIRRGCESESHILQNLNFKIQGYGLGGITSGLNSFFRTVISITAVILIFFSCSILRVVVMWFFFSVLLIYSIVRVVSVLQSSSIH